MKKPAKFRYALFSLVILACFAAWYFLVRVPYTRNKPEESALLGIYRPNLRTQILIKERGGASLTNCVIKVETDHKIELGDVLHLLAGGDTNVFEEAFNSTNGVWHLEKSDNGWIIQSEYRQPGGIMPVSLDLIGEKPPYSIRIYTWQTGMPFYFVQSTN